MIHMNSTIVVLSALSLSLLPLLSAADSSVPSRDDALEKGDKVVLQSDANIFYATADAVGDDKASKYCAPFRSKLTIESAPVTTTTTNSSAGPNSAVKTSTTGAKTSVESFASQAGDKTGTKATTETKTTTSVVFNRLGGNSLGRLFGQPAHTTCISPSDTNPLGTAVKVGPTYYLDADQLKALNVDRFGVTYGVVVVPNKVIVSTREFVSSSSVLPYIGLEQWGPSWAAAPVLAAGVGTAPSTTATNGTSSGTKATFTVATGLIGTLGGVFKVGLLVGVDTLGSREGYKYQGKPWVGISLGAGSQ